ncbi:unnamed protein product [Lymnaea stagnalis]|uniref:DUF3456 domain-containing protein n=1 Tax=Lymnaea stagnalis TaxID=6523 RepID=A0AAV2HLK3_LYMST
MLVLKRNDRINVFIFCFLVNVMLQIRLVSSGDMSKLREVMEQKAREQGIDPHNLKKGETFMIPPELNDEEEGSHHMPMAHRCDGCTAVAHQFEKAFAKAHMHVKKGHPLSLADVLDVADLVCDKRLREYGLKNINGDKYLSGEGLPKEKEPGILEAGGKWDARLSTLCKELIEKYEEDGIYDFYKNKGKDRLVYSLCTSYCSEDEMTTLRKVLQPLKVNKRDEF